MNIRNDEYYDEEDAFTDLQITYRDILGILLTFSEEELDEKVLNAEHLFDMIK